MALVLGVMPVLPASGLAVLYIFPGLQARRVLPALLASFIPYAVPMWLVALAALLGLGRGRTRWWAVPVGVALAAQTLWALPHLPHAQPSAEGSPVRLMALNVQFGQADHDQFKAAVSAAQPDLLVLTEVTDDFLERAQPTLSHYPYRVGTSDPTGRYAGGTMVYSTSPLTELERLDTTFTTMAVRVERPDGPLVLVAAHPVNPLLGTQAWTEEPERIREAVLRHQEQPVVVAGDLNATVEHLTVRRLLRAGLTDAVDQSGVGWQPTFSTETPFPPMIAIDHVLVNHRVTATGVRAFEVAGSDHRGIVAELVVR